MRIVITGSSGQLGAYLVESLKSHDLDIWTWRRRPTEGESTRSLAVDLTRPDEIDSALAASNPDVIFHLAAISTVEGVRTDPRGAEAVNVRATERLADWCERRNRRLVLTSTDLVFAGDRSFHREDEEASPILAYGRSKLDAERSVLATERGLVARLSLLFGFSKSSRPTFFDRAVGALRSGTPQSFFNDEFRTPLDYGSAVAILARLTFTDHGGLVHVGGQERLSRWDLMRRSALCLGIPSDLVLANQRGDLNSPEPRPRDVSLDTSRLRRLLPDTPALTVEQSLKNGQRLG